ncbi:hypothetical protein F5144DRAFT_321454 [Chaetomium tenue]|uniref:Uncharacterized protein n=1 Tax=Chaetomium tenue TaxID=1854479 RepID=A0ACB7P8T0_9PEZI|nr:hypothetical protein F5144DRAFT_321454 [Chaetomium globosum]
MSRSRVQGEMAEQCFGTGSRRLENSKTDKMVEERTGDAAGTRKTGRIITWKGSREAEERRRRVVCWKKWMAGPMRATRRLGLGCQSGARLPSKMCSTTSHWRYAIGGGPGAPQQRLSVGQVLLKTWAVLEQGKAWTAASSWLKVLRTRCPRVPLRGNTCKPFWGDGGNREKLYDWLRPQRCRRDGGWGREEGWPRALAYGKPRTESLLPPRVACSPVRLLTNGTVSLSNLSLEKFFRYDGEAPFWGHTREVENAPTVHYS